MTINTYLFIFFIEKKAIVIANSKELFSMNSTDLQIAISPGWYSTVKKKKKIYLSVYVDEDSMEIPCLRYSK